MGKIEDFGWNEDAKFAPDYFFKGEALPDTDVIESGIHDFGKVQVALGLKVQASAEVVVPEATTLTVEVAYDDDKAGAFTSKETIEVITGAVGDTTLAVGDIIVDFVPNLEMGRYAKVLITTSGTSTGNVDVFPYYIPR